MLGPFPYSCRDNPPPVGYKWVSLSYIPTEKRAECGWPLEGHALFLRKIPYKKLSMSYYLIPESVENMKRYAEESQKSKGKFVPSQDNFLKNCPTLNALMTDCFWDDGSARTPCVLKVRIGAGQACLILSDEDLRASVMTTAPTVAEAMTLLEDAMATGKASWRPWPTEGKRRR